MATYLDEILAHHRLQDAMSADERDHLTEAVTNCPPTRGFIDALRGGASRHGVAVIAEIKRRSPSRGDLLPDLDAKALARQYERGGATCLSVLTDSRYFGGSPADLFDARESCGLPVLRKDFIVSERDVYETRLMGADAMLLIIAALSEIELEGLHRTGVEIGLDVLVEVHDEDELEQALRLDARAIGVNQRDLHTFKVDRDRALQVGSKIPADVVRVAESGIANAGDVVRLIASGFDAILVGEAFVISTDPESLLREFIAGAAAFRESHA